MDLVRLKTVLPFTPDVISLPPLPLATSHPLARMDPSYYSGLCYPTTNGLGLLQYHVTDPNAPDLWMGNEANQDPPLHQYQGNPASHHVHANYLPIFPAQYTTAYNPIGISPILDDWHRLPAVYLIVWRVSFILTETSQEHRPLVRDGPIPIGILPIEPQVIPPRHYPFHEGADETHSSAPIYPTQKRVYKPFNRIRRVRVTTDRSDQPHVT